MGGLVCLPACVLAGDLPISRIVASETDSLGLTPTQKQKLTALESASRTQADQLIGQIQKLRHALSESYEDYNLDMAAVRRTNQDLNRVQGQLLDLRLSEQVQLRRILTPEQFAKLRAAIRSHGPDDDRHHGPDDDRHHDPDERNEPGNKDQGRL